MFGFLFTALIYVVPFLLMLTLVVAIHEGGHFLAAKACNVAIDRFSIGFGKAIFKRTDKAGVQWRIGAIPLGGYVRFAGDTNDASVPDGEDLAEMRRQIEERLGADAVGKFYAFKPVWQRAIIAAAGPAANFLLAIVILSALLMAGLMVRTPAVVSGVAPNTPAASAGFLPGDRLLSANGRMLHYWGDLEVFVRLRPGEKIRFNVERGGQTVALLATPERVQVSNGFTKALFPMGRLGLQGPPPQAVRFSPPAAVVEATRTTWGQIESTVTYLGRIVTGRDNGRQISGIIGMGHTSGTIAKQSIERSRSPAELAYTVSLNLILLTASISIGIGFVNLLPIPMLDGGHLVFYAYEAVARRPLRAQVQAASYRVGLALVLGLMLFATWNDLQNLQAFQFLGGLFS